MKNQGKSRVFYSVSHIIETNLLYGVRWHGQRYAVARGVFPHTTLTGKRVHLPLPPKTSRNELGDLTCAASMSAQSTTGHFIVF
ncbi:MAG TPA: hypothetical protein VF928_05705, partial [Usitatibacteraceae bacterium]